MQKVSHFWAQMKKKRKMSVRTFLPGGLQLRNILRVFKNFFREDDVLTELESLKDGEPGKNENALSEAKVIIFFYVALTGIYVVFSSNQGRVS